jgi:ELWxxDGT repeat protein
MVKDINPVRGERLGDTGVLGNTLFATTSMAELWKSDGTAEGTVLVRDVDPYAE